MSIRVMTPPRQAWSRVKAWVGALNASGGFQTRGLCACRNSALWLAAPHPVFGLSPTSWDAGLGMEGAALLSWRFVLGVGHEPAALVSVTASAPDSVQREMSLSEGALVDAHVDAFEALYTRFAGSEEDFALGCISISWLRLKAVWLRHLAGEPKRDRFVILSGPDDDNRARGDLLDATRFLAYLALAYEAMPREPA